MFEAVPLFGLPAARPWHTPCAHAARLQHPTSAHRLQRTAGGADPEQRETGKGEGRDTPEAGSFAAKGTLAVQTGPRFSAVRHRRSALKWKWSCNGDSDRPDRFTLFQTGPWHLDLVPL